MKLTATQIVTWLQPPGSLCDIRGRQGDSCTRTLCISVVEMFTFSWHAANVPTRTTACDTASQESPCVVYTDTNSHQLQKHSHHHRLAIWPWFMWLNMKRLQITRIWPSSSNTAFPGSTIVLHKLIHIPHSSQSQVFLSATQVPSTKGSYT